MGLTIPERRSNPRILIGVPMHYRQVESHHFQLGEIEDISADGALIWIGEALPIDSELIIRLEPDGPDEAWADVVATLLYKLPEEDNSLHGYGCSIELA